MSPKQQVTRTGLIAAPSSNDERLLKLHPFNPSLTFSAGVVTPRRALHYRDTCDLLQLVESHQGLERSRNGRDVQPLAWVVATHVEHKLPRRIAIRAISEG